MTINEFIDLVNKDSLKWINYCEIIILENGTVELAVPSHSEKLIEIYCNKMNMIKENFKKIFPICLSVNAFIIDKYNLIAVWHNCIMISENKNINKYQQHSLNILSDKGLIKIGNIIKCNEYNWYLKYGKLNNISKNL